MARHHMVPMPRAHAVLSILCLLSSTVSCFTPATLSPPRRVPSCFSPATTVLISPPLRASPAHVVMKADAPEQLPISLANAGAGALWVGLVAWSLTAAPGPLPDPIGPELVAKLAAQPVPRPADINEYATQGSNPRCADRVPGRTTTHMCEPQSSEFIRAYTQQTDQDSPISRS